MKRFQEILIDINARLSLSQPLKSHILLEIAGDLEDLYHHYLETGMSEGDAAHCAKEKFDVSDHALENLVQVHQTLSQRFSSTVHSRLKSRWESMLLAVSLCAMMLYAGKEVLTMRMFENMSFFNWPILIIAGMIALQGGIITYVLYIRKNPNIRKLQSGVQSLLMLGGISLCIGIMGYVAELILANNSLLYLGPLFIILLHEGRPDFVQTLQQLPIWYIKGASLMMTSICVAVFGSVLWHVLLTKLRRIEQSDLGLLLEE